MEIISDEELDKGKLSVSFSDGDMVAIAKIYGNLTGKVCDPTRLTQKKINTVISYIFKQETKIKE